MRIRSLGLGLVVAALLAGAAAAQDKPAKKAKPAAMDEKAAMEAMQKAATPGEGQKKLEPLVGTFDAKVTMWMGPSKPPEESTGTSETSWVLGNRFLETKYQGTFMGQPFSGIGYTGYDNVTKKYVGTWMDTMGTGMMVSTGTMTGNVMKSRAAMSDPMTGKMSHATETFTIIDNDHNKMEMWQPGPDGKNVKIMEINYTRKKT
ncbi:MAG TPA: DUF1579 domain-containing protein [Thermoanaerobaculia bacterium]|nr:DUF1579 domain-containing protein [Thermoanaerobaculia bacterium]